MVREFSKEDLVQLLNSTVGDLTPVECKYELCKKCGRCRSHSLNYCSACSSTEFVSTRAWTVHNFLERANRISLIGFLTAWGAYYLKKEGCDWEESYKYLWEIKSNLFKWYQENKSLDK